MGLQKTLIWVGGVSLSPEGCRQSDLGKILFNEQKRTRIHPNSKKGGAAVYGPPRADVVLHTVL